MMTPRPLRQNPRKAFLWIIVVFALIALAAAALIKQLAPQHHANVVVQAPGSLTLTFLKRIHGSFASCGDTAGLIAETMLVSCVGCRVVEKSCLKNLDARQRKILSGHPLDIPVMRIKDGAVAFVSSEPGFALQACRETERQSPVRLPAQCVIAGPDGIALSQAKVGGTTGSHETPALSKMLWLGLIALAISSLTCWLIIRSVPLHGRFSHDITKTGPQKFHSEPTPRIGGLAIGAGLAASVLAIEAFGWLHEASAYGLIMLALSAIPAFAGGFSEDVTKRIGPLARLILTFAASVFASLLVGATLDRLDMPGLDTLLQLSPVFAIAFTAFAVGGVINSINIIDGYNGLAGGYSIMVLAGLAWVAAQVGDPIVLTASLIMLGALAGFLPWNYPKGRIFMGDGGAYLLGFWLAELSVLLIVRNPDVSPWLPLLLLVYPVVDTLFSIYRRKLGRVYSAGKADALHLHQLIYTRLARVGVGSKNAELKRQRNNLVVLYICAGAALFIIPALFVWKSTPWLVALGIAFWAAYLWLYFRLARWHAPTWLIIAPKARRSN